MSESKKSMLIEMLKKEILGGKYALSRLFPSERALALRFHVSRPTVRLAMQALREEGLIVRRQGSGTYVAKSAASRKIGLIVPDLEFAEFFRPVVGEISQLAQKKGYPLLFAEMNSADAEKRAQQAEKVAKEFVRQGVTGVIVQPIEFIKESESINRTILSIFDSARIPVVLCDCDFVGFPSRSNYDVVGINNELAGGCAYEALWKTGARRICFAMRPYAPQSHINRFRGAVSMSKAINPRIGACRVVVAQPEDVKSVRKFMAEAHPDAFVCGNDEYAAVFKQSLEKLKIRVPEDVIIVGFDDVSLARLMSPPLTTIHQPCREIANAAFHRLLARIEKPDMPVAELFFSFYLKCRQSTSRLHR